jgi:MoxR-like ATPase
MESIEPVILAALIQQDPLLLIGPHGTGKSYLLNRLAASLRLQHRHYNASLLNFDDLVGYPLPNGSGGLDYIQTPASICGAVGVHRRDLALPPGSAEQALLHNPRALRAGAPAVRSGSPLVGDEPPGVGRRRLALRRVRAA